MIVDDDNMDNKIDDNTNKCKEISKKSTFFFLFLFSRFSPKWTENEQIPKGYFFLMYRLSICSQNFDI